MGKMHIDLTQQAYKTHKSPGCHPERLEKIADFRKESKDLRTDLRTNVP